MEIPSRRAAVVAETGGCKPPGYAGTSHVVAGHPPAAKAEKQTWAAVRW